MSERRMTWLRLAALPGLSGHQAGAALSALGGPGGLEAAGVRALVEAGLDEPVARRLAQGPPASVESSLAWLDEQPGRSLLAWDDADYPPLLRAVPDAPVALFLEGDRDVLGLPHFAVVGSRNPTPQGSENARAFARHLARHGLVMCSGLAAGIDAAAHAGALDAQMPTTAVLGCGPDQVYPAANAPMAEFIRSEGLLVSEFLPGTPPRRENFPRRNRIISGLSVGVLVVEAARRSGSLITARLAGDFGREVFAIPGSIHNPMARGCHQLLRQGAVLVETAADIFTEIAGRVRLESRPAPGADAPRARRATEIPPDGDYVKLLEALGHDPADADSLVARTGLTAAELSSMLLILELQGVVESLPGGQYVRMPERS
ncbi:MAG: DNA-processing protein DprA [Anaerolineae bacterium]